MGGGSGVLHCIRLVKEKTASYIIKLPWYNLFSLRFNEACIVCKDVIVVVVVVVTGRISAAASCYDWILVKIGSSNNVRTKS